MLHAYHPTMQPPRIETAMEFLEWCGRVELPRPGPFDTSVPGRVLEKHEIATKNAALEVLRLYFTGELDLDRVRFVKVPVPAQEPPAPPPGDAPAAVPVPAP